MALTETQVANRRSLGLKDNATTGQVFDVIEGQLRGGIHELFNSGKLEGYDTIKKHSLNKGLTKGAVPHRTSPPVKQYVCVECGTQMNKVGTGLGKWRCPKNKTHTKARTQKVA